MKFSAALKYQLSGMKKSLTVYYIVIYALIILAGVQQALSSHSGFRMSFGGFEMASTIFIFVAGLNAFKTTFHFLLANGVSRITMFESFLGTIAPLSAILALIDSINSLILSSIGSYNSMFYNVYNLRYGTISTFGAKMQVFMDGFVWMMFVYIMIGMIGFFITTLYYRMGKSLKLIVSIGVPVFLFIVLPYVDTHFFKGAIIMAWEIFFRSALGLNIHNPYIAVLTCFITFAIFSGLSFLTMRRVTVKQ